MKNAIRILAAFALLAAIGPALAQSRSGVGPCRIGAQALISMLDDKTDNSADYRHAYDAVTQSCGPASPKKPTSAPAIASAERGSCRDLALKLLDIIEDGKMNTQGFVRARETFAQSCPPR